MISGIANGVFFVPLAAFFDVRVRAFFCHGHMRQSWTCIILGRRFLLIVIISVAPLGSVRWLGGDRMRERVQQTIHVDNRLAAKTGENVNEYFSVEAECELS